MIEPIVIHGFDEATVTVREAVHSGIVSGLEAVGVKAAELVRGFIEKPSNGMPPAIASAELYNSIFPEVTPGAMFSRLLVAAGAPADTYVDALEDGARPHMPPVNALLPWVKQKFDVSSEKAALSIAWAIAINQRKKGMQGRHMFRDAQAAIDPQASSIIERQIAASLLRMEAAGGGHVAG